MPMRAAGGERGSTRAHNPMANLSLDFSLFHSVSLVCVRTRALQGVVRIPQAVAFLPTFSGVKMRPWRAGRVGNCFALAIPLLVPRSWIPSIFSVWNGRPSISLSDVAPFEIEGKAAALSRFPQWAFFFQFDLAVPL